MNTQTKKRILLLIITTFIIIMIYAYMNPTNRSIYGNYNLESRNSLYSLTLDGGNGTYTFFEKGHSADIGKLVKDKENQYTLISSDTKKEQKVFIKRRKYILVFDGEEIELIKMSDTPIYVD